MATTNYKTILLLVNTTIDGAARSAGDMVRTSETIANSYLYANPPQAKEVAAVYNGSVKILSDGYVVGAVNPLPVKTEMDSAIKDNVHTGNKEIRVFSEGHVCNENSTSSLLLADATFTGDWQDTLDYSEVIISVISDKGSATDGFVVEWSSRGVVADEDDVFTVLANKGKTFSFPCNRRYVRTKYTNGAVDQGIFDMQTLLKRFASKGSSHRITDSIVGEDDAALTKSVITGLRDDGVFGNVILDNENRMVVSSQPYTYGIAENSIAGHTALLKFGTRTAVAANTQSVVWEGTNPLYTYLTVAQQLKVVSASAQDGVGGTGIRTLTIVGLDANFDEVTEVVTMNGLTQVTTANSYIRIFRAYGSTSGTSLTNVGDINIYDNAGTLQLLRIVAGDGQTLMTIFTIPRNKTAYLIQLSTSNDSGKGARISLFTRLNDGGTLYPWQIKYRAYIIGGDNEFHFNIPFKIAAKTDIEIRVTTPASAGTTSAGATFELWYEDI